MSTDEERALLAGLRDPSGRVRRDAEHALFERYRGDVDRLLRRVLGDDTDDCLQEVFVDVFRGVARFQGEARLSTWIYRVALRRAWKCSARRRRHERGREGDDAALQGVAAGALPVEAGLAAEELARRFARALAALDLEQRTVMALSALDGLGPAEIAEVLGVPVGTVHSRTSRARARLRELLGVPG